jgi:multidrug efflux pump subunit AcrB
MVDSFIVCLKYIRKLLKVWWRGHYKAMLESIKIRTRPVLMTAFAVSVGMLPVAQGSAIGLERLAPLGAVAIGGLVVGTLMTLIFIPVGFVWLVDEESVVEE